MFELVTENSRVDWDSSGQRKQTGSDEQRQQWFNGDHQHTTQVGQGHPRKVNDLEILPSFI